jgi:rifampicin phosphotransferase
MMIIQFGDCQATDAAIVGGKAASLGRMTQAGFQVPPGFTVLRSARFEYADPTTSKVGQL